MNNVLKGLENNVFVVYMDDIIIFSTSLQEDASILKLVFQRLRDSKLKAQFQ